MTHPSCAMRADYLLPVDALSPAQLRFLQRGHDMGAATRGTHSCPQERQVKVVSVFSMSGDYHKEHRCQDPRWLNLQKLPSVLGS